MVLENRVLTKCFGISKHHTQRPADDLSRTDGDSSGKVWGTIDSDYSAESDYNEGEAALLKGLLTARKDGQLDRKLKWISAGRLIRVTWIKGAQSWS